MKVLVIGSGGREHALVWKIGQSPQVRAVYCAPGNAGIAEQAQCVPLSADDVPGLTSFAAREKIDLTVVGPEGPLSLGIVDTFTSQGLRIFGPSRAAAALEASKSFAKYFMKKYNIPCGESRSFENYAEAVDYIKEKGAPIVVKADGLAAGKGVILCPTAKEALEAVEMIMVQKTFGDAGNKVVVEEFLEGEEASFLAFTDGETVLPLPSAQDHKAIYDQDRGPNTGGMGAYSPAPVVSEELHRQIMDKIMIPAVRGMAGEGRKYKGVLYAGLMIRGGQAKVMEFNARFGDPETQPILMRLNNDLLPILQATVDGTLKNLPLAWDERASVCVVMASAGYPGAYVKGRVISGLQKAAKVPSTFVFHAGTAFQDRKIVTNGGRVLGVTALGWGIREATRLAYETASKITWEGAYYRKDIGHRAIAREEGKSTAS